MSCYFEGCENYPDFSCSCSNGILVCRIHISTHLISIGNHNTTSFILSIGNDQKPAMNLFMKDRINLFGKLMRYIIDSTEKTIKLITETTSKALKEVVNEQKRLRKSLQRYEKDQIVDKNMYDEFKASDKSYTITPSFGIEGFEELLNSEFNINNILSKMREDKYAIFFDSTASNKIKLLDLDNFSIITESFQPLELFGHCGCLKIDESKYFIIDQYSPCFPPPVIIPPPVPNIPRNANPPVSMSQIAPNIPTYANPPVSMSKILPNFPTYVNPFVGMSQILHNIPTYANPPVIIPQNVPNIPTYTNSLAIPNNQCHINEPLLLNKPSSCFITNLGIQAGQYTNNFVPLYSNSQDNSRKISARIIDFSKKTSEIFLTNIPSCESGLCLFDEEIFAFGGCNSNSFSLKFNLIQKTVACIQGLPEFNSNATAGRLKNNIIVGGYNSKRIFIYNPRNNLYNESKYSLLENHSKYIFENLIVCFNDHIYEIDENNDLVKITSLTYSSPSNNSGLKENNTGLNFPRINNSNIACPIPQVGPQLPPKNNSHILENLILLNSSAHFKKNNCIHFIVQGPRLYRFNITTKAVDYLNLSY